MSIDDRLKEILKSYYFVKWGDDDECVDTILPEIKKVIAEEAPEGIKIDEWDPYLQSFQTGYNAYRTELLSKLGVKE